MAVKSGRGRPRDPGLDRAIIVNTMRLLARDGFAGLSLDEVAKSAGAGKASLYRRYNDKRSLVVAGLKNLVKHAPQPLHTGFLDHDLYVFSVETLKLLRKLNIFPILCALIVQAEKDKEPLALLRRHVIIPRQKIIAEMLRRAKRSGQVRADLDIECAVDTVMGAVFARMIIGQSLDEKWIRRAIREQIRLWR